MNWLNNGVKKSHRMQIIIAHFNIPSTHHGLKKIFLLYIQLRIAHSMARNTSEAKNGPILPMDSAIPEVNTSAMAGNLITVKER